MLAKEVNGLPGSWCTCSRNDPSFVGQVLAKEIGSYLDHGHKQVALPAQIIDQLSTKYIRN